MIGILCLAAVLNHRGTNAGIDKALDREYFRPATVRLAQQSFNRRQIALGLGNVDHVVKVVVAVYVRSLQLQATVVLALDVGINLINSAQQRLHRRPAIRSLGSLAGLESLGMGAWIHD